MRKGPGLGLKMSLAIVTLMVFLFLMMSSLFIRDQRDMLSKSVERSGISLTQSIAQNCRNALMTNDYWFLTAMTREMSKNENILFMAIVKPDGIILTHSQEDLIQSKTATSLIGNWPEEKEYNLEFTDFKGSPCLIITVPIYAKQTLWGFVQTANSLKPFQLSIERAYYNTITVAVLFMALGTVFILLLSKRITVPLMLLTKGAQEIGAGNLAHRIQMKKRGDELGLLAVTFNQMARDLKKSTEKLEESKKLERELELAYQIQQSLLPSVFPAKNGIELTALCKPARIVGGDFYDFIELSYDKMGIIIGDVSGKSIQSALYMAITQSIIRSEADREPSPRNVLISTNRHLSHALAKNSFVTLSYMVMNKSNGAICYASAGHNPMLVCHRNSRKIELIKSRGFPLGMEEQLFNERIEEIEVPIETDDILLLFTDGIIEAMNTKGEEYSLERFLDFVHKTVFADNIDIHKINDRIIDEISNFSRGTQQHDDITLVTLKVNR